MTTKRLLVLDDDEAVARTIAFIAEELGFEVRIDTLPHSFFDSVESWRPTHIALDLVMPAMDGIEILAALFEMECKASIILASGMGAKVLESAQLGALERGLNVRGILPKPFKNQVLEALLSDNQSGNPSNGSLFAKKKTLTVVEKTIRHGLDHHQFILHYQPKIELSTGRTIGFEGLMRWDHPDFGLVYPDAFIHVAEQTGQINPMTHHIIISGLNWLSTVENHISLAINISARSLRDSRLIQLLSGECKNHAIDPNRVILELTETSTMMDPVESLDTLTRLRIKGFRLGIDDFGTGYSSMVQLARLPFSELKIDKSFVMSMETSSEAKKIVASTISLGRSLGLTTVAEGVETEVVYGMLKDLDCHLGQGYFFAKPMSASVAKEWVNRWNKQA